MNTFGQNIKVSIFGESHGKEIGLTIDGLPSHLVLDIDLIKTKLVKRQGRLDLSTPRREPDEFTIISGLYNNKTTGAPLTIIIPNLDIDNTPYEDGLIRPGHSDLSLYLKYKGANDPTGGGHGSGRLTAPLVILGAICEQILLTDNIKVISRISSIKDINDIKLKPEEINPINLAFLSTSDFPVYDKRAQQLMINAIKTAKRNENSLGGKVETYIFGLPAGLGEPFFNSFESIIAHLMFSIPGIKGIEFGDGFDMAKKYGSDVVDQLEISNNNEVIFLSNHQGGLGGGITNGNYVKFTCGIRPPASIPKPLASINIKTNENILLSTLGRHDPTICHRVLPVIDALTYFAILDLRIEDQKRWLK